MSEPKTADEVRTNIIDVIVRAKTKLTKAEVTSMVDAMLTGLRKRAIAIVDEDDVISPPDEHLQTLKHIRRTLREAVDDTESKRDLASLTRRLQDISREVTTIEERHRAERAERGGRNGATNSGATTSTQSGPLSI